MAQFNKAKYNEDTGVLSYNYLGGKEGKGKGGVSIKNIDGNWFFVDKSGKVRKDVGIKGKLTSTHIQNLRDDGIFDAVNIDSDGTQLSKAEIPGPEGGYSSKVGDSVGIGPDGTLSDGSASVQPSLAERGNLRLSNRDAYDPTGTSSISPNKRGSIDPVKTLQRRGVVRALGSDGSEFEVGINSGESSLRGDFDASLPNAPAWQVPTRSPHARNLADGNIITPHGEFEGNYNAISLPPPETNIVPTTNLSQSSPYGGSEFEAKQGMGKTPGSVYADKQLEEWGQTSDPRVWYTQEPLTDYIAEEFPDIGPAGSQMAPSPNTSGKLSMPVQESTTPGITGTPGILDKKDDSSWGADEWTATGSVLKGIGGLASAYTGIQNYRLARDAHNAQQRQWQANYDQRLRAYQDNKNLANMDIASRNRTLLARNPNRTDLYKELA